MNIDYKNGIINKLDQVDIDKILSWTIRKYTFFSSIFNRTFIKIDHIINLKHNLENHKVTNTI